MGGPRVSGRENLRRTIAAFHRGEAEAGEMARAWSSAGGVCCPGCMFPGRWSELEEKQDRRLKWIDILTSRVNGGVR